MPLYVYVCPSCHHSMEVLRPLEERDQVPKCDNPAHRRPPFTLRRVAPVVGIVRNPAVPRRIRG